MIAMMFLLTVILTNVRQRSGPKCLKNVSRAVYAIGAQSDSSRPVTVMLPTICCSQLYIQRQLTQNKYSE